MFPALPETEKAVATVAIFIATFFGTLTIGRFLKRRAGVRLGLVFQLFCLTVAFYAAVAFYGVHAGWRSHLGAAVALLSTGVIIALIDRYVWDAYFEGRRETLIPHFLRQVVALAVFFIALLLVLSLGYHAERELKGVVATSGVAAIILAIAAQNLLGGIIAGASLQISRPYKVGDWLHLGDNFAEVMEINWRSTRFRTNDGIYLDIPNNEIVRQTIVNLHYPTSAHAMRIRVGAEYSVPPNRVKDALFRATAHAAGVLPDPPAKIFVIDYAESAVVYEIKFWLNDHADYNDICDAIRTNIWYEFKGQRITIPFPIRTLRLERKHVGPPVHEGHAEARAILRGEPLFQCLPEGRVEGLLKQSQLNHFGRGERIIEEGAQGDSMFVLLRGTAHVSVSKDGASIRVGTLRSGDCFGEMSLLTGERRTATIRADADCYVMEIGKPLMAEILRDLPECLDQLSELLAKRKLETEGIVKDATKPHNQQSKQREYTASFMDRLKTVFEL